jgi:hypothetical protein
VLSWNWPQDRSWLNWLAPISVWVVAPAAAVIVVIALGRGPRRVLAGTALAVAAITLTAIGTRVSSAWTISRPVTTEAGSRPVESTPSAPDTGAEGMAYADAVAAGEWLSGRASAVVATGDPASSLVPALSGRQMFLAGERYQVGLGPASEEEVVLTRALQSRAFAAAPSDAAAGPLCEAGVDYVWLEPGAGPVPEPAIAYRNGTVRIVELGTFC